MGAYKIVAAGAVFAVIVLAVFVFSGVKVDEEKLLACAEDIKVCEELVKTKLPSANNCEEGICHMIGLAYANTKNFKQAIPYYEKDCGRDFAVSCNNLGVLYLEGTGVKKDSNMAFRLFTKADNLEPNNIMINANLAYCYEHGFGTNKNMQKALSLLENVCELRNNADCYYEVAQKYADLKQISSAIRLLEKSCALNHAESCTGAGALYILNSDIINANTYFAKACNLGSKDACNARRNLNSGADAALGALMFFGLLNSFK